MAAAWRARGLDATFLDEDEEEERGGPGALLLVEEDLEGAWPVDGRSLFTSWLPERSLFLFVPDRQSAGFTAETQLLLHVVLLIVISVAVLSVVPVVSVAVL